MSKNIIGRILNDQYRVDAFIDSGGMGAVYRVWDLKRSVPLAMKVLHADLAEDPSIFKRFKREANALKKLTHPNIVPFYGLFQTRDFAFLLELYVDGPTLKEILRSRRGQPLSILEALIYLKAISAALGYAHVHGVVHCDVKPGNVMVDQGGSIYLTDFGIARHAESTATTMVTTGTTSYMAPEQIRDEPVSPGTDVYALGVMFFEMLTGQRPFLSPESGTESSGPTAAERIRYAHLHLPPPNPSKLNPAVSETLAAVILKALAKAPIARYQDISQMVADSAAAAGMHIEDIPSRVDVRTLQEQKYWQELTPAAPAAEVFKQQVVEAPPVPVIAPPKRKPIPRIAGVGAGLLAVTLGVFCMLALFNQLHINFPLSAVRSTETQVIIVATTHVSTQPPSFTSQTPTNTAARLTGTTIPATITSMPSTKTPNLPTITPHLEPLFTAYQRMFCRDGPGLAYEAHVTISEGEILPILRMWSDGHWLLVGINRTDTRTKCCWIGGEGTLNVDRGTIQRIDYLPDRIKCNLNP